VSVNEPGLRISTVQRGGERFGRVAGELDAASVRQFELALARLSAIDSLVIDLSRITLLDSAGLRVIARTHERLAERGASLVLASPSLEAMRVLGATGLSDVIQITFADRG